MHVCVYAVKRGAIVDVVDQMNVSPLLLAVEGMHMSVARLLINKDARTNVSSNSPKGTSPWMDFACKPRAHDR